eukprot:gene6507-13141_t
MQEEGGLSFFSSRDEEQHLLVASAASVDTEKRIALVSDAVHSLDDFLKISAAYCLVPLYFMSICGILNSVACRTNNTSIAISWTALLVISIVEQKAALSLYFISLFCAIFFSIFIMPFLDCIDPTIHHGILMKCAETNETNLQIASMTAFLGICSFFVGYSVVTDIELIAVIARNGADRPRKLKRNEVGGWDIDRANAFDYYLFFGHIEINAATNGCSVLDCGIVNDYCGRQQQQQIIESELE